MLAQAKTGAAEIEQPDANDQTNLSSRQIIAWGTGAVVAYLGLRLTNLMVLPIFLDEGLHISTGRGAQAGNLWVLGNAGRALQGWLLAFLYNLSGTENLLLVARLLSVLSGLVTLGGCYLIGRRLYNVQVGLIAAWLWAIMPFVVWHERMALVDPLMTSFTTLVLVFSLRLFDAQRPTAIVAYAILLGLTLTCAELAKLSGVTALIMPPLVLLLIYPAQQRGQLALRLLITLPVLLLATVPILHCYNGVWGEELDTHLADIDTIVFVDNLRDVTDWFYSYLTAPFLLLMAALPSWCLVRDRRRGALLLGLGLLPMLGLVLIARISFARYVLYMLVPFFILLAAMLNDLGKCWYRKWGRRLPKAIAPSFIIVLTLPALWLNWQIITDPPNAALPHDDQAQYIEEWPSGYGLNGAANFLTGEAKNEGKHLTVLVAAGMVTANQSLPILLNNQPSITVTAVTLQEGKFKLYAEQALAQGTGFVVVTRADDDLISLDGTTRLDDSDFLAAAYKGSNPEIHLSLVYTSPKPGNHSRIEVYQLIANK